MASRLASISPPAASHGPGQTLELVFDGVARNEPPRDAKSLGVDDQRFADGDAGRNGDSLKFLHVKARAAAALAEQSITTCAKLLGYCSGPRASLPHRPGLS